MSVTVPPSASQAWHVQALPRVQADLCAALPALFSGQPLPRAASRPWSRQRRRCPGPVQAAGADVLKMLGLDFLTFLAATVLVIPVFKSAKLSPILGFLFSGLLLGQLG